MSYAERFTRTGDIVRAASRCYIRRTCTGEIKDNAKKKIQRIARRATCGREERQREAEERKSEGQERAPKGKCTMQDRRVERGRREKEKEMVRAETRGGGKGDREQWNGGRQRDAERRETNLSFSILKRRVYLG